MDGARHAKKAKMVAEGYANDMSDQTTLETVVAADIGAAGSVKAPMYVKVNMEGFVVGRKIDLAALDCYNCLDREINKLIHYYLWSTNYGLKQEDGPATYQSFFVVYEDNEGDRLAVGDEPWEDFLSTVKRLHICTSLKKLIRKEDGEELKVKAEEASN